MKNSQIWWSAASAVAIVLAASPLVAQVNDKPIIAPAPAWVKPVALPLKEAPADDSPVRLLLNDQQAMLLAGKETVYTAFALKIQTPQGLSAGNISLPWRPDSSTLTVHKLLIRRGAQVIDVLAGGQGFIVVRRESNLESAVLDGVLTANIQPEGLQVGDVLELATSVTSSDPTLKDHVEQIGGGWNAVPIARVHLRMEWPNSLPIQVKTTDGLPPLTRVKGPSTTSVELTIDDAKPLVAPKYAPSRFSALRFLELSDYRNWAQVSALMAPLYAQASTIPADSPLQGEIAKIRAASSDPRTRAEAALQLVENRVRYVGLAIGTANFVPADVATTWTRRYGDCKGKTAMLIGLLKALGIDAVPVLVNTGGGDGLDAFLPMAELFDHVMVRASIAGKTYWMDSTRVGDMSLDRLEVPNYGWGLIVAPSDGALVRMVPPPPEHSSNERVVRIDATAGISLPAPFHAEQIFRGDMALGMKQVLANLVGDARDRALREFWKREYDFVDVAKIDAVFDDKTGEQRLTMDGSAKMKWGDIGYETDGTLIGYKADFARDPGPFPDAPIAVAYPYFSKNSETILLPKGFGHPQKPNTVEIDQTVAGIHYHRESSIVGDRFTVEKSEQSLVSEFPYKEAAAAQKTLREWAENAIYLRRPESFVPTEKEVSAKLAETPTTAEGFFERAGLLFNQNKYGEAIADFDRADQLKPKDVWTLANRGLAHVQNGDTAKAEADLRAAEAVDPTNYVAAHARGLLAVRKGDTQAAIAAYGVAIRSMPLDLWGLHQRAEAYRALKDYGHALSDLATLMKITPGDPDLYLARANILLSKGDAAGAAIEAERVSAIEPATGSAHLVAAKIYSKIGARNAEMREYDRAVAVAPEAYIYVIRANARPIADIAGRRSDLEAALKLEPTMAGALIAKSRLEMKSGNFDAALAAIAPSLAKTPSDADLLIQRGMVLAARGDTALADKDFATARSTMTEATQFNIACWTKATANIALASALLDCERALALMPGTATYEDSLGLVLFRLGRFAESVAAYDKALAHAPDQVHSLYVRGIAKERLGNWVGAQADRVVALAKQPGVKDEFDSFGLHYSN